MEMATTDTPSQRRSHGWLDSLAIGMSVICAIHCLLTPLLVIFVPILATSFWVHEDFHWWVILFILPTTGAALFLGCRRHGDRATLLLSLAGIGLLVFSAVQGSLAHSAAAVEEAAHCASCAAATAGYSLTGSTLVNVLGGTLLASAHVRNFQLCRKRRCTHC